MTSPSICLKSNLKKRLEVCWIVTDIGFDHSQEDLTCGFPVSILCIQRRSTVQQKRNNVMGPGVDSHVERVVAISIQGLYVLAAAESQFHRTNRSI